MEWVKVSKKSLANLKDGTKYLTLSKFKLIELAKFDADDCTFSDVENQIVYEPLYYCELPDLPIELITGRH